MRSNGWTFDFNQSISESDETLMPFQGFSNRRRRHSQTTGTIYSIRLLGYFRIESQGFRIFSGKERKGEDDNNNEKKKGCASFRGGVQWGMRARVIEADNAQRQTGGDKKRTGERSRETTAGEDGSERDFRLDCASP